jgi:6-phosphogluconolactonase
MGSYDLQRFLSPEQLAGTAANDFLKLISLPRSTNGCLSVALSGGRIARTFCAALASQVKSQGVSLYGVHFFWSDERCVPPDDPESNFRLAYEALLTTLKIPTHQIHRIQGEKPPAEASDAAEADLRQFVSADPHVQPVLDLVLLGMGEDGHVASLFPEESERTVTDLAIFRSVTAVKPPPLRITMGYLTIAAARNVWVLASGKGKEAALSDSLQPDGRTPLARVLKLRASTSIYSDLALPL